MYIQFKSSVFYICDYVLFMFCFYFYDGFEPVSACPCRLFWILSKMLWYTNRRYQREKSKIAVLPKERKQQPCEYFGLMYKISIFVTKVYYLGGYHSFGIHANRWTQILTAFYECQLLDKIAYKICMDTQAKKDTFWYMF